VLSRARAGLEAESARITAMREQLWQSLRDLPGAKLNGHAERRAPGILNITFAGVEGESLFTSLQELTLATGSACNSRSGEPSYVLRALGRDTGEAQSSLRFSLGWGSTGQDIATAIAAVRRVHAELWNLSPARPPPPGCALGEAGAERLGTWVRFAARIEGGQMRDASVQVFGCPHVTAACRYVVDRIEGRAMADLDAGSPGEWRVAVGAPVEKLGAMLIIEDALAALCREQNTRS
jgi:hypothetical protein